jgi:hypothetical protein
VEPFGWRRSFAIVVALVAGLLPAATAAATITSSSVSSPSAGAELFYDGDRGSGTATVRGTVTGQMVSEHGDLLCYSASDSSSVTVAKDLDVSSGSFALQVSLASIAGQACRLRLVPATTTPKGPDAARFSGPAISVSDQQTYSSSGSVYTYYVLSGTLPFSFALKSIGDCPINSSYATDPSTLASFSLFDGNACLRKGDRASADAPLRSALQIDGLNAYAPAAIGAPGGLSGLPGFEPLAYSARFNSTHDAVTVHETELPTICDPPTSYPPTTASCPSLHDSGLRIDQTTTLLPGGQVARVRQRVSDVDGHAHSIDALFAQSAIAPAQGESPGFEFGDQKSFATHAKPDTFSAFPPAPGSIVVLGSPASAPAISNPVGTITFSRRPLSADFVNESGGQIATFLMHYADVVPARGSLVYDWSFSQAASTTALAPLERHERDRMARPTVSVKRPPNRSITHASSVTVSGFASDNVAVRALTVNGRRVRVASNGAFSTSVGLRRGRNVIKATATDGAGNATTAKVTVHYRPSAGQR